MTKPRLFVSFSGGKTSGYMAKLIKDHWSDLYEIVVVFANTSREDEKTLIFVNECDKRFGLNVVWIEAEVFHGEATSSGYRIVTFETASRNGEVFEEVIKKYGISNAAFGHCNREMKLNAMHSYVRDGLGWDDYCTALGIRMDEQRRVSKHAGVNKILYPLIDTWPTDKQDVANFWENQPFQLDLPEHLGNCVTCFKKSDRKLFQVYADNPYAFLWNARMEAEYGWHGAPWYGEPNEAGHARTFWRGNRSTEQVLAQARELGVQPFIPIRETRSMDARQFGLDFENGGCSESCEAYPMEDAA
jgi:hypothetical protein